MGSTVSSSNNNACYVWDYFSGFVIDITTGEVIDHIVDYGCPFQHNASDDMWHDYDETIILEPKTRWKFKYRKHLQVVKWRLRKEKRKYRKLFSHKLYRNAIKKRGLFLDEEKLDECVSSGRFNKLLLREKTFLALSRMPSDEKLLYEQFLSLVSTIYPEVYNRSIASRYALAYTLIKYLEGEEISTRKAMKEIMNKFGISASSFGRIYTFIKNLGDDFAEKLYEICVFKK